MNRVLIIGSGGSGKTTLARRLAERTGLPLIHLDALYWRPGWDPTPGDEWRARIAALVRGERWIIDGNYGGTLDLRLEACDTVIFLDVSRWVCLWRGDGRRFSIASRHSGRAQQSTCSIRARRPMSSWTRYD